MTRPFAFRILTGGPELLDRIEPLWKQLREHHAAVAPKWASEVLQKGFKHRKTELLAKGQRGVLVLIATAGGADRGYCVGTVGDARAGEVDSLFVDESFRGREIGSALLGRVMQWFDTCGATSVGVELIAGNDKAMRFYERFGFAARTIYMKRAI